MIDDIEFGIFSLYKERKEKNIVNKPAGFAEIKYLGHVLMLYDDFDNLPPRKGVVTRVLEGSSDGAFALSRHTTTVFCYIP
jgi:hypothetical protein